MFVHPWRPSLWNARYVNDSRYSALYIFSSVEMCAVSLSTLYIQMITCWRSTQNKKFVLGTKKCEPNFCFNNGSLFDRFLWWSLSVWRYLQDPRCGYSETIVRMGYWSEQYLLKHLGDRKYVSNQCIRTAEWRHTIVLQGAWYGCIGCD